METIKFSLYYDFDADDIKEGTYDEWRIASNILTADEYKLPYGGMIVLSTDVNAEAGRGLAGKVKSFFRTWWQRFRKKEMIDEEMMELLKKKGISTGWSIGNLFDGRYYDKEDDKLWNEKSLSVDVRGVEMDFVKEFAKMLGKKFKQKQVLVVDHKTGRPTLLDT